jgi:uncharacterized protein YndB with AHSA1/START domain
MEKIRKFTFIEAPPAKIFGYLTDATHLPEIWPSMVEVSNVQTKPDGAHSFDWTYKMAGVRFHGHSETIEVQRDRLRLVRNASGIPSTFRWTFEPRAEGTDLALEIEYEMPRQLLARLAAPFLRRLNDREADALVHNLKERMEAGEPAR